MAGAPHSLESRMTLKHYVSKLKIARELKKKVDLFVLRARSREKFECPVCSYTGPFFDVADPTGLRKHALCPRCGALERHRLQFLAVNDLLKNRRTADLKMLHFAPEPFFQPFFSKQFGQYETADLSMTGVDHNVDLQQLPFDDCTYDFVFASHVLEHVSHDEKAISEIRRVLRPNGIAILPVPLLGEKTVEYPAPNPNEWDHVRAPGLDYFTKYDRYFSRVDKVRSDSLPAKYQLFIYEDRSKWPTKNYPSRLPTQGEKHIDVVPICYV
jgi:SAM-dependent methyltransferase